MISVSNDIEREYIESVDSGHRKKYAQFFTPVEIAEIMSGWLLGNKNLNKVLEPAYGLGIFSRCLLSYKPDLTIDGYELDETIYDYIEKTYTDERVHVLNKDYIFAGWSDKYDGIICNPPYLKFHNYDNNNVLNEISNNVNYKFSALTNLYAFFLVKSASQLNKNGRMAYIIPSEFMNSDYGVAVKEFLIEMNLLRYVAVFHSCTGIFDDAITTSSILLCANDAINNMQFYSINNKEDLYTFGREIADYPNFTSKKVIYKQNTLSAEIKWKTYYQARKVSKYRNLVPFSLYANVKRGIATGDNSFFCLNSEKASEHHIPDECLIPCVCKCQDVINPFFSEYDYKNLVNNNKPVYLFAAENNSSNTAVKNYLQFGINKETNKRFLTSKRTPWYALEKREVAQIWVSVFNRKGLKFIKNETDALTTTTFHNIYFSKTLFSQIDEDVFFAYLLTDTAKEIFSDYSREYGNGLIKYEPNDLNKSRVIDFSLLTDDEISEIRNNLNIYRDDNNYAHIQEIDNIIKEKYYV